MEGTTRTEVRRERTFTKQVGAPRETVFRAWTDPLRLRVWWGPRGFTAGTVEVEPRPGGLFHVDMQDDEGKLFPMRGEFREVEEPSRLVFTSTLIADPAGGPPLEALNTVTFAEQGEGTEVTWRWSAIDPAPNPMVDAALEGAEVSTNESLSRLAEAMARERGGA